MLRFYSVSPESGIVEKAEEMKVDLIIVGSHGYSRWERLLLGSVSDPVCRSCPLLRFGSQKIEVLAYKWIIW